MFRCIGQKRLVLFIGLAASVLADGSIQSAGAQQCAPDAKIYIDPRLVPQRQHISPQTYYYIMTGSVDPATKEYVRNAYFSQYQPIQVPFRGGTVLISPTDPCIQQYIGQ
jgi:hypothetical protein